MPQATQTSSLASSYNKKALPVSRAPAAAVEATKKLAAPVMNDDDVVKVVAKALEERMRSTASSHDALLDEKKSLSAVLAFSFSWRKEPSAEEVVKLKKAAEAAGRTYVPDTSVAAAPLPVSFDAETLNKAFGGKLNFAKEQYLLSAYIESAHSSAPYPLAFTLSGVQGKALHRVFSNDGTASTLTLAPSQSLATEREIYRMANIDADDLYAYGSIDLKDEISSLTRKTGTNTYFVPAKRFLGKVLANNLEEITKTDTVEYIPKAEMYMVEEHVIADILSKFHDQVLMDLKTTDFTAIKGTISRADRTAKSALSFADATDAPGLGSLAAREAAHNAVQHMTVNVRFQVIDPANLRKDEQ